MSVLPPNGINVNTSNTIQSVGLLNFTVCSTLPRMNYTFKNETPATETVKATLTSSLTYYAGSGTVKKTTGYTSGTEAFSYAYCLNSNSYNVTVNGSIIYDNGESQQRQSILQSVVLSNTSSLNQTLYLLPDSLGQYVTFQTVNYASQTVSGVLINVTSATFGSSESKYTDDSGAATFWLNPLTAYTVSASKVGYPTNTSTITPSSTQYTIVLGNSGTTAAPINPYAGIKYIILPSSMTLVNDTTYTFSLNLSSTVYDVTSWGIILYDGDDNSTYGTQTSSTNGGLLEIASIDIGKSNSTKMNYWWVLNGTTVNSTYTWITVTGQGTEASISNFITDLKTYLATGIFGIRIGTFTLNIIVFLLIFLISGGIVYKFGISDAIMVASVVCITVVIFDVGFDLITYPSDWANNGNLPFASMVCALFWIAVLIRERTA